MRIVLEVSFSEAGHLDGVVVSVGDRQSSAPFSGVMALISLLEDLHEEVQLDPNAKEYR